MSSDVQNDDVVIKVDHVSKCFEMYEKPRHRLQQMLFGKFHTWYKKFWALKDVSFDVHRGECVGLIGRNGAGKSTILQIITGTLQPTEGSITIKPGLRVAALLELGSGFNPEFTGRDNVYMNAAILGLTKDETDKALPEIEKFADIGEFIDQPVKAYSSGMMVRLAFAVQVMIKPDLLIVDEALAVGDATFQQKCYQRIQNLQKSGTTILFVSHDLNTVQTVCNKAVYMVKGQVDSMGDTAEITERYFRATFQNGPETEQTLKQELLTKHFDTMEVQRAGNSLFRIDPDFGKSDMDRPKDPTVEITAVDIYNEKGERINTCNIFDTITLVLSFVAHKDMPAGLYPGFGCKNDHNINIFTLSSVYCDKTLPALIKDKHYVSKFRFKMPCPPNKYFFTVNICALLNDHVLFIDDVSYAAMLEVLPRNSAELKKYYGYFALETVEIELSADN